VSDLQRAMAGHQLGQAELTGLYACSSAPVASVRHSAAE
jgi:hypothetical protein